MKSKPISPWEEWNAKDYLNTYYRELMSDARETLDFLSGELKAGSKKYDKAIEFGAGPTLYSVLGIALYINKIDIAEYLPQNRQEVKKWVNNNEDSFDWSHIVAHMLKINNQEITPEKIEEYTKNARGRIRRVLPCDIREHWPLLEHKEKYNLLVSSYCADSCTDSKTEWMKYMHNLFQILEPGGVALISALKDCKAYRAGDKYFPCANISEKDIEKFLSEDSHEFDSLKIQVAKVPDCTAEGFSEVMFVKVRIKEYNT